MSRQLACYLAHTVTWMEIVTDSVRGQDPTMRCMADGLVRHNIYHAAQIALQNRILKSRAA